MRRRNDPLPITPPLSRHALALSRRIPHVALRYVVAVAEYLNIQHAGAALGVSPSSISARIKTLEIDLGVQLLERCHRGVRLTAVGRMFVDEIAIGIHHVDHAVRITHAVSSGSVGQISIGIHTSMGSGFIAELRRRYHSQYPGIDLVMVEASAADVIRQVRERVIDVCFAVGPTDAYDCHTRALWSEPLVIALPSGHPLAAVDEITWGDLATEIFIVRNGSWGWPAFEHVLRRTVERDRRPRILFRDVGRDMMMHLVAAGDGMTLTCESNTCLSVPGVAFRPIEDEPEQAHFHAVWSPHNTSPALRKLLDLATAVSEDSHEKS